MKEALILAGGMGTRLRSAVPDVPKPMATVGGKPFLTYLLDYWIREGVNSFVISVGYKADVVSSYFNSQYRGARISYIQEQFPLGTGGAIKKALQEYKWGSDQILLINGDTWFEVDLAQLIFDAAKNIKPITVTLKALESNNRYGAVIHDDSGVQEFDVNINGPCYVNGGCYLLNIIFFLKYMEKYSEKFSFENDVLKELALKNMVNSSIQRGKFLDIGVPEDYRKAIDIVDLKVM
jgi:D-glycero-alpha-D-manno-heptose 1-phosphate guanylyltransferase